MRTKLYLLLSFSLIINLSFGQVERCGTMQNLEEKIKKDPTLKTRMIQIEKQNQEWIEKSGLGFKKHSEPQNNIKIGITSKSTINTNALCSYDNTYSTTLVAPVSLNNIVSPSSNCIYGGEYVRVNNLVAGRTYRISTIGTSNFDTQITIYTAGGGNTVAFNDDWNGGLQSEIYFTPINSGNYDILINQFGCTTNQLCSSLQIELWYIPRPVITIPVIVHVMHEGTSIGVGKNISVAQIQSQIDVLNEDFRRLNEDILTVAAPFRGASADPLIQFCLAQQKPDGTPTNGILRYGDPSFSSFTRDKMDNEIKPSTNWDRNKYLNIWTIQFGGANSNYAGYASLPTDPESIDGVVISYTSFGRVGNLVANFNLGRTTTHEVGHWLNLKHIWGNEIACASDDEVIDTPLQSTNSSGCNIFPKTDSCTTSYPGVMFQNFMDYSNDNCQGLFTFGQSARMDSALFNQRAGLLTSQGCVPASLNINQYENTEFSFHPNPTSSKVFFDNSIEKFEKATVINYLGQVIAETTFDSFEINQEIDLSSFTDGIYILKLKNQQFSKSVKIIKQ